MKRATLCIVLLVLPMVLLAQSNKWYTGNNFDWKESYKCYLADSSKAKFKSVTVTAYNLFDSTGARKKLREKDVFTYDTKMNNLFDEVMDSNLVVTDSERYVYDKKFRLLSQSLYTRDDSTHTIYKSRAWIKAYNEQGHMVKDSDYMLSPFDYYRSSRRSRRNHKDKRFDIKTYYYKYVHDTLEAENVHINVSGTLRGGIDKDDCDTTFCSTTYNEKGQEICEEGKGYHQYKRYFRYDNRGNTVFFAYASGTDSNSTITTYNGHDSVIERKEYEHGILKSMSSLKRNEQGLWTSTEETLNGVSWNACVKSKLTVTVYDKAGRIITETETNQENGNTEVTTTTHTYLLDKGRVITDSIFTTTEGHLHSMTSEQVEQCKYDVKGKLIEDVITGGGTYVYNSRKEWKYNERGQLLALKIYNACVADKPESETYYEYYTGGTHVKKLAVRTSEKNTITWYDEEGRIVRMVEMFGEEDDKIKGLETIYEYKK